MIKVSIIVPVWNTEKYIEQCLNSLVNQTIKEKEIIIINDGSPDKSENIIKAFQKKYPKLIKYIKKENGGQGSARNRGLEIAKGEFIGFVDSDDWVDKTMYENMYNIAIKKKADLIICDMMDHFDTETIYYDCTHYNNPFEKTPSACNKLFKKEFINNIRFFEDNIWYEDMNFTCKVLLQNPVIENISKGFYHCHAHNGSTMINNNSKKNLDIITCIEDIKDYAIKNKLFKEDLYSYMIFNHVLITTIMRVASQDNKQKESVLKELLKYCHKNIGNYKKYNYYKDITTNRKIIANLNFKGLYKISLIIIKIKQRFSK